MDRYPLFDCYLMVDWSAASAPRTGRDSIWLCRLERRGSGFAAQTLDNPPTRLDARERLRGLLAANLAAGRPTLAGFDFPLGYPAGFAETLGGTAPTWSTVWGFLAANIEERPRNGNNRFAVAARLNQGLAGDAALFWGRPSAAVDPFLPALHPRGNAIVGVKEWRLCEARHRIKGPQSVFKLYGAGSVGSQALTGIPVLHWLRRHRHLAAATRVWPFETGLRPPVRDGTAQIVFAEIYPSLVTPAAHPVRDAGQVSAIAAFFAAADSDGRLAEFFAADPALSADERAAVVAEEGWILGATALDAA